MRHQIVTLYDAGTCSPEEGVDLLLGFDELQSSRCAHPRQMHVCNFGDQADGL